MAYDSSTPPRLVTQDIGNTSGAVWNFKGLDAPGTVAANGYITNAKALGMKAGDEVRYIQANASDVIQAQQVFRVAAINVNGSGDLTDGTTVSLANAG